MCISPLTIKNTRRGLSRVGFNSFYDCESAYLKIPCGHCYECKASRQNDFSQRVLLSAKGNYIAFATLTYSPEALPTKTVYNEQGQPIMYNYADFRDIQTAVRQLRQSAKNYYDGIPFKYIAVSERGGLRKRPHFHVLMMFPKACFSSRLAFETFCVKHEFDLLECWCRNHGTRKMPDWQPNCRFVRKWTNGKLRSNYDFHAVSPRNASGEDTDDLAYYVSKYVFKELDSDRKFLALIHETCCFETYREVRGDRCRCTMSKHLWSGAFVSPESKYYCAAAREVIDRSIAYTKNREDGRFYFVKDDGTTAPLGNSIRKKLRPSEFCVIFAEMPDGCMRVPDKYRTDYQLIKVEENGNKVKDRIAARACIEPSCFD